MAWTNPTTRSTGNLITASIWNTDLVDNLVYLKSSINAQIQIDADAWTASITDGASQNVVEMTTNDVTVSHLEFANSGGKVYAERKVVMPGDYNSGTVTATFYWTVNSTSTNSVVWGLQARSFANSAALDQAYGTAQEVTSAGTGSVDRLIKTSATSAITIAGSPAPNAFTMFKVYRDSGHASDTLAATARLLSVLIEYTRT